MRTKPIEYLAITGAQYEAVLDAFHKKMVTTETCGYIVDPDNHACGVILRHKDDPRVLYCPAFSIAKETSHRTDGRVTEDFVFVIRDRGIRNHMRNIDGNAKWIGKEAAASTHDIVKAFGRLKSAAGTEDDHDDGDLLQFVIEAERICAGALDQIRELVASGETDYASLWAVFEKGDEVYAESEDGIVAGVVKSIDYRSTIYASYLEIEIEIIDQAKKGYMVASHNLAIMRFEGTKKIDELSVRKMDEITKARLTKRGKLFAECTNGMPFVNYSGHLRRSNWWSDQLFRAEGRAMIDISSFFRMDSEYMRRKTRTIDDNDARYLKEIPEDLLWTTSPTLYGFSFAAKRWGEMSIEHVTPIDFNDRAFDQLVLDEANKKIILSLVQHSDHSFADIIAGKGGGVIFLLHGEPGVGKTLTAEAVAEVLHRPLYSVSVGELGTDPKALEESLRQILEIATVWNAVVLLDEADIFLEARTEHDILRNSMVGVFLRLLEYHQGVMFLTTNRVRSFDPAFHSRIGLALKYDKLGEAERAQVWHNLLTAAGAELHRFSINELAKHDLNGRQIKSTIRLAQTIAKGAGEPFNMHHINDTIHVASQFKRDLAA